MADELTDQLFDILEDFIVENRALHAALALSLERLPEPERSEIDSYFRQVSTDQDVHAAVQRTVARLKNQPLARTLRELRKGNWRDGD
ncbi:MAG: hypothetical protein ABR920_02760 [Terriglobales bacterium]